MKTGIELIAAERQRQMESEGWTAEHDAIHTAEELAIAAAGYTVNRNCYGDCYCRSSRGESAYGCPRHEGAKPSPPYNWPWERNWWKPSKDPVRNLAKAGALIAAEIDRIQLSKKS